MRRPITAMLLVLACAAPGARADTGGAVVVFNSTSYAPERVVLIQGRDLAFGNLDPINDHTVTSQEYLPNELPLFDSGIVRSRQVKTMTDVARLPAGLYPFYCSAHYGMTGTLEVRPA